MTAFGALDYGSGDVLSRLTATGDAAQFRGFLDRVIDRWADGDLVLVLDNASYHKTAELRVWFAAQSARVSVIWLPTYSPQLNLIERVWRFAKSKLACHRFWNDLDGLTSAAQSVLDHTQACFAADSYPHITLGQDFWKSA